MGVIVAASAAAFVVLVCGEAGAATRRSVRRRVLDGEPSAGRGARGVVSAATWSLSRGVVEPEDEVPAVVAAVAIVVAAVVFGPVAALFILAATVTALMARRRSRRRLRALEVDRHLPEVIDLLGLVVGAGRPTASAMADVAPRVPEPFRTELSAVVRRADAGESFVDAVRRLRTSLGPSVVPVVHAVTAAEVDGTPLRPALQRAGDEAQRRRRVRAQEAARRVPVLMLFPLVFCVLPAFCLLTVVPLLVGTVTELGFGP